MSRHRKILPFPSGRVSETDFDALLREGGFDPQVIRDIAEEEPELVQSLFAQAIQLTTKRVRAEEGFMDSWPEHLPVQKQVSNLLSVPGFEKLDASWALAEGDYWYSEWFERMDSDIKQWIEGPVVYPKPTSFVGGYYKAFALVLDSLERHPEHFQNGRKEDLREDTIRQLDRTAEMEARLAKCQPGDFLVVLSQSGRRHRRLPVDMARMQLHSWEFCLGALAEGCRRLTHSKVRVHGAPLNVNCAGDEVLRPSFAWDGFQSVPYFAFRQDKTRLGLSFIQD